MFLGKNIGKWNFCITLFHKYKDFSYGIDLFDVKCCIEKEFAALSPLVQFQFDISLFNYQIIELHISKFVRKHT